MLKNVRDSKFVFRPGAPGKDIGTGLVSRSIRSEALNKLVLSTVEWIQTSNDKRQQTRAEGPPVFTVRRPPRRTLGFCKKMLLIHFPLPVFPSYNWCDSSHPLWCHGPVVDADVINQAGPEGPRFHSLAGAKIQAAI